MILDFMSKNHMIAEVVTIIGTQDIVLEDLFLFKLCHMSIFKKVSKYFIDLYNRFKIECRNYYYTFKILKFYYSEVEQYPEDFEHTDTYDDTDTHNITYAYTDDYIKMIKSRNLKSLRLRNKGLNKKKLKRPKGLNKKKLKRPKGLNKKKLKRPKGLNKKNF